MMRLIKNFKVVIVFALFGSIFGNSCNTVPHESGVTFHKTFISCYVIPEHMLIGGSLGKVTLLVNGDAITSGEIFDELSRLNNDLSYNRYAATGPTKVINGNISKIELETVDAFDANHPAGSDISELVELQYISFYDYIQNGYRESGERNSEDYKDMGAYYNKDGAKIFKSKLSEIDYADMKLVADDFVLKFYSVPKNKGIYKFKLIFRMQDMVIETLFEHEF